MVLTKLLAAAGLAAAQTSYAIAGQRQCQPLGPGARCDSRGLNPTSSMVSACRAPALETCAAFRSACEVQLGRLRDVCGLDV